jgi:hypothetical protein
VAETLKWGRGIFAADGTPRAPELALSKVDERDVGLVLIER